MSDQTTGVVKPGERKVSLTWTIRTTETFKTEMTVEGIADTIGSTPEEVTKAIEAGNFDYFGLDNYPGDDWLTEHESHSTSDDYSVNERGLDEIDFM